MATTVSPYGPKPIGCTSRLSLKPRNGQHEISIMNSTQFCEIIHDFAWVEPWRGCKIQFRHNK